METPKNSELIKNDIKSLIMDPLNFTVPLAKKEIIYVPIGKPKNDFCMVHKSKDYRAYINAIQVRRENVESTYLICPNLVPHIVGIRVVIFEVLVCVTREGKVFLWLIKLPDADKNPSPWNLSERECAKMAEEYWVKISSDKLSGRWNLIKAVADLGTPKWPQCPLTELIEKAFIDKIIMEHSHPVLRLERGEI